QEAPAMRGDVVHVVACRQLAVGDVFTEPLNWALRHPPGWRMSLSGQGVAPLIPAGFDGPVGGPAEIVEALDDATGVGDDLVVDCPLVPDGCDLADVLRARERWR
ncbi:MAG: hypothetical protein ACRDY0_08605, partial [Acidimicrobiales bacterium]